jgi:nucleoside-diphosphate-sugar epimerase
MSRIAVPGGAGFLGTHLTAALRANGHSVRVLDVAGPVEPVPGVEYLEGDVRDHATVSTVLADCDAVVHLAFASPRADLKTIDAVNVGGTGVLLDVARDAGVARFVLVSSTIVGRVVYPHPLLRSAPASRIAAYRHSRIRAEHLVRHAPAPMTVAVARPKTFVGPGRVGGYALVLASVRAANPIVIFGVGTNRYQVVDVRDLADGLRRLVESHANGVFGFGAAEFGTVGEDLAALVAHAGSGADVRSLPTALGRVSQRTMRLLGLPPLGEWHECCITGADSVIDIGRAVAELGWNPARSNARSFRDAYDSYVRSSAPPTHPIPPTHRAVHRIVTGVSRLLPKASR